ncbi:hypothetical protein PTSG_09713 [Salpingoeca rosetta]|uniref:Fibrinogen C-terminal domain-containing protein n=1 Tax=Salpingoeca rosetta (strain ATCC 50818 / BSB-021) TaxID=946362 RepID=F2UNU2_SALR5|nr:uncharacterized protein PTSG_09713 [Salpingoeca rosetta]EGD79297.1 hypothetical protein PTSG_09713 [Salpingoeca rosetta]|eukprot:XP_004989068.1 hypothetical protein PTSG_09713 [Salpingoeca rosetta]
MARPSSVRTMTSHTLTLLAVLLLTALVGTCTGEAVLEEDDFGRLIINTTDPSQPVLVNGVDVQELQHTVASLVNVARGSSSSIHPCSIGLDTAAFLGHKCETRLVGGDARPWTLAARFSNDGVDTWTWSNYILWSNNELVGTAQGSGDFKGTAWFGQTTDLLFVSDIGEWIAYEDALAQQSLSSLFASVPVPCSSGCPSFAATQQNITSNPDRCDTKVYLNPRDHDPNGQSPTCGFGWSFRYNQACPLDDVGHSGSLGPDSYFATEEQRVLGFLGRDSDATFVELYVR